jgi:hypothetical protein
MAAHGKPFDFSGSLPNSPQIVSGAENLPTDKAWDSLLNSPH